MSYEIEHENIAVETQCLKKFVFFESEKKKHLLFLR